jgi:enterochelin esterase-like enzyme
VRRGPGLFFAILITACAAPASGVGAPAPVPSVDASPSVAPSPAAAPTASPTPRALGKGRVDKGSFRSNALARTMPYLVYLPPGYDQNPKGRYATAYVLHGGSGLNTEWVDYGLLDAADRLMGSGEIRPFIIVLPQGDQEYWVDHVIDKTTGANGEKWGTYVARDVVPTMDARYRTIAAPPERAIGGLSMGGHGAMQLSLNFPGIWSAIVATSPSLRPESSRDPKLRQEDDAPTYLGFGAEFAARDPLSLIKAKPELARQYTWWIDTGRLDPWLRATRNIHEQLAELGIPHEWDTPPGGHDAPYWSAHVEDYLRFYASVLCRDPAACPSPP